MDTFTSQFFWGQMNCVSLEALSAIEDELTGVVVRELGVKLDTLFYDTTNFLTYIASTNTRSKLTQRGNPKQKRVDLRLFSLVLLVSRDGQIPLCSEVYEGNKADANLFLDSLSRIRQRLAALSVDIENLTIVYDKGNMSKANQALGDEAPCCWQWFSGLRETTADDRARSGSSKPEIRMPRISSAISYPTDPRLCIRTIPLAPPIHAPLRRRAPENPVNSS